MPKRWANVIFMICDDPGYGDPGCDGSKLPEKPLEGVDVSKVRIEGPDLPGKPQVLRLRLSR